MCPWDHRDVRRKGKETLFRAICKYSNFHYPSSYYRLASTYVIPSSAGHHPVAQTEVDGRLREETLLGVFDQKAKLTRRYDGLRIT